MTPPQPLPKPAARSAYAAVEPYLTKDGSTIRELLHPDHHALHNQSLAEARVATGGATALHRHRISEELYHVTRGSGHLSLGVERFVIQAGDSVVIAPGVPHRVENTGSETLVILCCCAPAYSHADTELLAPLEIQDSETHPESTSDRPRFSG